MAESSSIDWVCISAHPLSVDEIISWATRPECGAVVTFCGTVRNSSPGRDLVQTLEYETSPELAEGRITDVIAEARRRWPSLGAMAIHHRIGTVELGATAVVVAVSAPHRREAFDAAQYCIDTVKESVPMWKREVWDGGSDWSEDHQPIIGVRER